MSRLPAPRRPQRRAPFLVVAFAVLALAAAACSQSNTPQFYNSVTRDNFMQGCTGGGTGTTLANTNLCDCLYTVTTGTIPASTADKKARGGGKTFANYTGLTFIQINDALKSNPNSIPKDLQQDWVTACGAKGYVGTTTTTAKPTSGGGPTTSKP